MEYIWPACTSYMFLHHIAWISSCNTQVDRHNRQDPIWCERILVLSFRCFSSSNGAYCNSRAIVSNFETGLNGTSNSTRPSLSHGSSSRLSALYELDATGYGLGWASMRPLSAVRSMLFCASRSLYSATFDSSGRPKFQIRLSSFRTLKKIVGFLDFFFASRLSRNILENFWRFSISCWMERTPKLCLELARVTKIDQRLSAWLESYGTGPILEPCPFLDAIELDELQFLRLPADVFRNPRRPSLRTLKRYCRVANLSESFYRCISEDQWLRTVIVWQDPIHDLDTNVTIHSNVVPTQAYLGRLEGLMATCGHQCCGGFFPANSLREIEERHLDDLDSAMLSRRCRDCALAKELMVGTQRLGADDASRLLSLEVGDVELVRDLGKGSEGTVSKVLWRRGTFARKRFKRHVHFQNVNFNKELDVARTVSHPNIVHFFGCSSRSSTNSGGDFELFMELLDMDLGSYMVEGARLHEGSGSSLQFQPFSFQDSLDVLLQIAEAVRHLHERNFVHGDLKPQNILINCFALTHSDLQYYLVKVADFGCAQRIDSSGSTVEPFRCDIGTLRYTAPEVLNCRKYGGALPEHPQKIDVYSFGVVAYQVVAGVTNLYEDLRNSQIIEGVIRGQLRPDFDLNRALIDEARWDLLRIIRSCWTALPENRPSFSQVCSEIRALLNMEP